jgi:hypothetical protein
VLKDQKEGKGYSDEVKSRKPPLYKKHPTKWEITIQARLGVDDKLFNGIKEKEPFINKMLMNQVIPAELKNATHYADKATETLLNLQSGYE